MAVGPCQRADEQRLSPLVSLQRPGRALCSESMRRGVPAGGGTGLASPAVGVRATLSLKARAVNGNRTETEPAPGAF